ncbi:helix-turn-helix transcriptional regulator [Thermoflavimicrobium daqui]|uniref:Molybdopterin biosynthesis protein n=1 Tax=Thermoflavimicrobium daqui TaxID=2137476 RepID=A0A364K6E8_9BACL|nr:helix-turn-helix transcriptional regulator [Thermoflavimicrobium daqui]RAL25782.1 hypothetical protein DL897_06820 [Thermoflavimicrobium daqui]
MSKDVLYTTEEIAQILKVSKLTVYDLIKKGELPAYRVGRQMRIDPEDLERYKAKAKGISPVISPTIPTETNPSQRVRSSHDVVISGQDISLDILARHMEKYSDQFRPLRSYAGSLNSLMAMFQGECDIVSTHLFDGETGEYNVPYIRRILMGHRYKVVNLISRWIGFFVQKGNPKSIQSWEDLLKPGVRMIQREKGSGTRVFIDEQLHQRGISPLSILGSEREEYSHLSVAGAVASNEVDVGIGIEKAALVVGVDFIPLMKERYDLVILKETHHQHLVQMIEKILTSDAFKQELKAIGGYDVSRTGQLIYETY